MNRHDLIIDTYRTWVSKKDNILDVGCGHGKVAQKMIKELGCKISGTDILDYSQDRVYFTKMEEKNKIPFTDNSFDITMLNDVLHHSDCQEELINECLRVSKKLFIFETNKSFIVKLLDVLLSKFVHQYMNTPLNFRSYDEWKYKFNNLKLKIINEKVNLPSILMPVTTFAFEISKNIGDKMDLKKLRDKIVEIDMDLLLLLKKRNDIVNKIIDFKIENDLPVRDKEREAELFELISKKCKKIDLHEKFIKRLYDEILNESCRIQQEIAKKKK